MVCLEVSALEFRKLGFLAVTPSVLVLEPDVACTPPLRGPSLGGALSRSKQVASGKIGGRGEPRPFRHWCEGQASRLYSP